MSSVPFGFATTTFGVKRRARLEDVKGGLGFSVEGLGFRV